MQHRLPKLAPHPDHSWLDPAKKTKEGGKKKGEKKEEGKTEKSLTSLEGKPSVGSGGGTTKRSVMAPFGAGLIPATPELTMSTSLVGRSTPFELVTTSLTETRVALLTNLLVWLLALVSGIFLSLRLFAIWYRKLVLVIDDCLLIAAWVSTSPILFLHGQDQRPYTIPSLCSSADHTYRPWSCSTQPSHPSRSARA